MFIFHDQSNHMAKIYTKNTLIQLLYGECNLFETLEVEHALDENFQLREEYSILKEGMDNLSETIHTPKSETIRSILTYARRLPAHC